MRERFWKCGPENPKSQNSAALLLQILALANLMTALIAMPIQLQIAYKHLRFIVRSELTVLLLVVPAILLVTPIYGAPGAAMSVAILQAGVGVYLFAFALPHSLPGARGRWLVGDTLVPLAAATLVAVALQLAGRWAGIPLWLTAIIAPPFIAGSAILTVPWLRTQAITLLRRVRLLPR